MKKKFKTSHRAVIEALHTILENEFEQYKSYAETVADSEWNEESHGWRYIDCESKEEYINIMGGDVQQRKEAILHLLDSLEFF